MIPKENIPILTNLVEFSISGDLIFIEGEEILIQ